MIDQVRELFRTSFGDEPTVIAQAPGRIEFVGNHTDYNGGDVLGVAVEQGIVLAVRKRTDRLVKGVSHSVETAFEYSLDELETRPKESSWSRYPLGVLWAIQDHGLVFEYGFDFAVVSNVPSGAGMSSSAALELATAYAVLEEVIHEFSRKDIVRICRYAENHYVGVPCGILDQGVSGFGKKDHLVSIDCKNESFGNVPIPSGTHFWIFNTDVKHSLVDSLYSERFSECGEGFEVAKSLHPNIECLVDYPLAELDSLGEHLGSKPYRRVNHVLNENQRVKDVVKLLGEPEVDLHLTGKFLFNSHASSRDLFRNSTEELDYLVSLLEGYDQVFGARLTGGGFGGAAMAWTSASFSESDANAVSSNYERRFGHPARIIHCESGDGAHIAWKESSL
jgi:galactokinase